MPEKNWLSPTLPKLFLTILLAIFSALFIFTGYRAYALYTNWLLLLTAPLTKTQGVATQLDLVIFFGTMLVSGYVLASWLITHQQKIIQKLKPTKKKTALFFLLIIFSNIPGIGTFDSGEAILVIAPLSANQANQPVTPTYYGYSPVFWFPYWFEIVFLIGGKTNWGFYGITSQTIPLQKILFPTIIHQNLLIEFPAILLYWYLLAVALTWVYESFYKQKKIS